MKIFSIFCLLIFQNFIDDIDAVFCNPFCSLNGKAIPPKHFECLADHIVLIKHVQTEIFTYQPKHDQHAASSSSSSSKKWAVRHRFHYNESMKDWRVYEEEMAEQIGQVRARQCFAAQHQDLVKVDTDKQDYYIEVKWLFGEHDFLMVSEEMRKNLDKQMSCVSRLLPKYFMPKEEINNKWLPTDHRVVQEHVHVPLNLPFCCNEEILEEYKLAGDNVALRLGWGWFKKPAKEAMIFKKSENLEAFQDFEMCDILGKLVKNKKHINEIVEAKEFVDVQKMLDLFKSDQLFMQHVPTFHTKHLLINKNEHPEILKEICPICLQKFEENEEVKIYSCQHIFHVDCIEKWLDTNPTCPVCRTKISYYSIKDAPKPNTHLRQLFRGFEIDDYTPLGRFRQNLTYGFGHVHVHERAMMGV